MINNTRNMLENYLIEHIPISAAMGVKVGLVSSQQVILSAPLANNINHKKTVFGGSLHALATLACWSLLHINLSKLHPEGTQIVISNSSVEYLLPATTDFKAECSMPSPVEWERFIKTLQKKGKARIHLKATINQGGRLCLDYAGTFVAIVEKT